MDLLLPNTRIEALPTKETTFLVNLANVLPADGYQRWPADPNGFYISAEIQDGRHYLRALGVEGSQWSARLLIIGRYLNHDSGDVLSLPRFDILLLQQMHGKDASQDIYAMPAYGEMHTMPDAFAAECLSFTDTGPLGVDRKELRTMSLRVRLFLATLPSNPFNAFLPASAFC